MATQYPDGIDSTSSLPYVTNGTSPMVGDDVNRLRDAIVAVETELGINPSGTFTSVDARLGEAEAAIAGYANSTFLVLSADGFVSQERVFSPSVNFDVVDGGAGANFEIDLAANVGIGTITPASDYSLTLDGDGATRIGGVILRNTGTDTFYIGSATASDSANISLMNPNAGYVTLGTDGTERIRITSTGEVGLGTSLPAGRLHVSGGDLLVDTGDVGIGTLTPSELLHISGGNLLLESTAGAGLPYATMKGTQGGFQMSSGNGIGKLDVLNSTGAVTISLLNNVDNRLVGVNNADFSFYTNNTEKMRITAGGDLLVNSTANPDLARLHISGGGITHSSNQFNARPGAGINYEWVNRNGAGHTWYVNSASAQAMTLTSAGNFGIGTSLPVSQFSVGSSSEFRVDSSGDITRISDVPYNFPVVQGVASSVLKNNGSGSLDWSLLADTEIVGGLQTVADITARDAIPSDRRKEGMLAYSQADDRHFVLEGGLTNSDWKEFGDDNRLVGGLQTVTDTTARDAIPVAKRKEGMIVYSQADDRHFVLEGGTANVNWLELGDDNRLVGGLRIVADDAARDAIPQAKQKIGMIVYVVATGLYWRLSAIAGPPGTFVAWLSDGDLIGGFRVVTNQAARYAIPSSKQSQDMLVLQADTNELFRLNTPAAPPTTTTNWRKLFTARGRSTTDVSSQIGVDFISSADGTNDVPSVGFGALDKTMVRNHLGVSKARVLNGCELVPSKIGAGPFKPGAYIDSGSILFANGFIENVASIEANLGIGGVASDFINDEALPSYPANVYVYAYRVAAGTVLLKASTTPPTAKSTFGGVPTLGTAADYAYVGLMRPKAASGSYVFIWGSFTVAHDGNGNRRILLDTEDAALEGATASITLNVGVPQTLSIGPVTAPSVIFPTASTIIGEHTILLLGPLTPNHNVKLLSKVEGGYITTRNQEGGVSNGIYSNVIIEAPNRNTRPNVFVDGVFTIATSLIFGHSLRYVGLTENVNRPSMVMSGENGL